MTDDARKTLPWSSIINKDCGFRLQSYELEANIVEQNVFTKFCNTRLISFFKKTLCTR